MSSDAPRTPPPFLYLASPCYGGLAQAAYMRSVLALRAACADHGVALQIDLGGGEALISRARAAMLAKFLATEATHLLFVDGDMAFEPAAILPLMVAPAPVANLGDRMLLVRRDAALQIVDGYPDLHAGLGDVRNTGASRAAMVFETILDPATGGYFADLEAFAYRWRRLGGEVATS